MASKAALAAAFKVFDTDGSGTLSAKELLTILTRKGKGGASLSVEDAKQIIASVDYNGDGELDVDEVSSTCMPRSKHMHAAFAVLH